MSVTAVYRVEGMTCQHCVNAVTQEVSRLAGVTSVEVVLDDGSVTVTSDAPLAVEDVRAAVDEAGYDLA